MDERTPRPWRTLTTGSEGCSIVTDEGNGKHYRVARLTNAPLATCEADAALIVEAVNAYDRLRAIEAAARDILLSNDNGDDEDGWGYGIARLRAALEVPSDAR